ncbi:hypothetical protein [Fimbriiglobus ruber]|uniref:Uncharacterized protein n=1 Tax=Fimbriiglobus ruber TaxID=1908690 RepID=A0A225EEH4_9BACT|nr:hypothetical protein [Fimbriiglobus ruber]OWK46697.1 hypothetical protein FRUB_00396 [Fimbriiglobus ruber]
MTQVHTHTTHTQFAPLTQATTTGDSAVRNTLRDMAFVLQMTQRVKESILRDTPAVANRASGKVSKSVAAELCAAI